MMNRLWIPSEKGGCIFIPDASFLVMTNNMMQLSNVFFIERHNLIFWKDETFSW